MNPTLRRVLLASTLLGLCACSPPNNPTADADVATGPLSVADYQGKAATPATLAVLEQTRQSLPKGDFLDGSLMGRP